MLTLGKYSCAKTDEFSDNFQTAFVLYHSVIIYLAMIMSRSFFCHRHEKLWKLDESENVKKEPKSRQLSNFGAPVDLSPRGENLTR